MYRTDGVTPPVKIELNTGGSTAPKHMAFDQGRIYFRGVTPSNGTQVCSFVETNPSVIDIHLATTGGTSYYTYVITGGQLIMIQQPSFDVFVLHTLAIGSSTATPINHDVIGDLVPDYNYSPVAYNGKAYFNTLNHLISADGSGLTIEQTNTSPQSLVVANNELYFLASPSGTNSPSYLHRLDNTGTITDFPSIPLVRLGFNNQQKSLFVFGSLMYGWIADGGTNGIYKFHFTNPALPSYSANLPSKPNLFESSVAIDDVWYHVSPYDYNGSGTRSILKTSYLGCTVLCTGNIDFTPSNLTLFNNDLYFIDAF